MSASDHPDLPTFFNACEGGHESTVRLLLYNEKNPVPVNAVDTYGNSALHQAAKSGRTAIIRTLLGKGASASIVNNYRETALHKAAEVGSAESVKVLLSEGGADPNALDMFSTLPIQVAAKKGHKDVVKAFVTLANADPEVKDKRGTSLMDMANDGRHLDLQVYLKSAIKKWNKKKAAAAAEGENNTANDGGAAVATSSPHSPPTTTAATSVKVENTNMTSTASAHGNTTVSTTVVVESSHPSGLSTSNNNNNNNNTVTTTSKTPPPENVTKTLAPAESNINNNKQSSPSSIPVSNSSMSAATSSSLGFSQVYQAGAINSNTEAATNKAVDDLVATIKTLFPPYYIFDFKDIEIQKRLGSGGGGSVFRALIKSCHRPVAAKLFREADVGTETALRECQMAKNLHHKNIIQLTGVTVVGNLWPLPSAEVMMLMELGDGTLQGLLSDFKKHLAHLNKENHNNSNALSASSSASNVLMMGHRQHSGSMSSLSSGSPTSASSHNNLHFTWERIIRYTFQIASGLEYLHQNSILHLDLKPANCLIDSNHIVKLCDFGLTRGMQHEQTHIDVSRVNLGTRRWMSPEQSVSSRVAPTNDIYSWGAILFNMINEDGLEPWSGMDANEIARTVSSSLAALERRQERIKNGEEAEQVLSNGDEEIQDDGFLMSHLIPRDGCPKFLINLCKRCLAIDYTKRPKNGAELVQLMKDGVTKLLEENPETAGMIVGDVTYMELSALGDLHQESSESKYGTGAGGADGCEQTEVIEGGGYDF